MFEEKAVKTFDCDSKASSRSSWEMTLSTSDAFRTVRPELDLGAVGVALGLVGLLKTIVGWCEWELMGLMTQDSELGVAVPFA